jgi:hypothetical protein
LLSASYLPARDLPISSSPPLSALLPTLQLPPLGIKSENIRGNKYYVKESDDRIQHLGAKIEPESLYLNGAGIRLQFHASSEETMRTCAREKKTKYFTMQWQCLMTFH